LGRTTDKLTINWQNFAQVDSNSSLLISGLKESLWEKAIFHVTLYFSEHYNEEPPEVVFNTIPFHPNGMYQ